MKVVVTGATGNVGSSLLRLLADDPRIGDVVALARRPPGSLPEGVVWRPADVLEDDLRPVFEGADVVVHLAWLIQPTRDVGRLWDVNVRGTAAVLDAVVDADVGSVIHASSVGAYSPGPSDGSRVDESWPTHGIGTSSYSRAKAYTERLLDAFELRHPAVRVVRLRPALIFKAGAAPRVRRLFLGPLFPRSATRPAPGPGPADTGGPHRGRRGRLPPRRDGPVRRCGQRGGGFGAVPRGRRRTAARQDRAGASGDRPSGARVDLGRATAPHRRGLVRPRLAYPATRHLPGSG